MSGLYRQGALLMAVGIAIIVMSLLLPQIIAYVAGALRAPAPSSTTKVAGDLLAMGAVVVVLGALTAVLGGLARKQGR